MQRQQTTFKRLLLSACCSAVLTGCGGSGTVTNQVTPETTSEVPVSVIGRITAFGSVYVNGVRYDTDSASLNSNGPEGTLSINESDLKVGMVVNLTGTRSGSSGVATSISYNELLEAPITAISLNSSGIGTITAGGKTINISNTTTFYGGLSRDSISSLLVGDWVEVSGYQDSNGVIDATMISYEDETSHNSRAEIEGIISNLDTGTQTFTLNGIQVDYSTALIGTSVSLSNGLSIEVSGTLNADSTLLTAAYIEQEDHSAHDDSDSHTDYEYELQGVISDVTTGQFTLAGVRVLYDGTTLLSGLTVNDIKDGVFLEEVEGRYNTQGQFVASKIEMEDSYFDGSDDDHAGNELEISGSVNAVNTANNTLTVLGYTVTVTSSTLLKDDDQNEHYFNINSLNINDYVEAVLLSNADGTYTLRKLERESSEAWSSIEGRINQVNADNSVLIGSTTVILPSVQSVTIGQRVEADGSFDPDTQTLTAVRFEYDD